MNLRKFLILTVLFLAPVQVAKAQESMSLENALALALQNSPESFAITYDQALRYAESYDVEAFDSPELELGTTILEDNSSTGVSAEVTVPLKPSLFKTRPEMAKAIREISSLEHRMQTLSLKHRVIGAYLDLWMVQEHKDFLKENLKFARNTHKTVASAASRGEVGKAASTLFHAEVLKYEDELLELDAQEKSAQIRLFKLINVPLKSVSLEVPELSKLPEGIGVNKTTLPRDILAVRARIADMRVKVAEQDAALPDLSPRFTYSEGFDSDEREFGIGLRLQLPFGNPYKAEVTRARAEQSYATASLQAYDTLGYEALLQRGLDHARLMQSRARQYREEIIPAFEQSFTAMKEMFKNGQASVIELWQFHERLHEAELKRLQVLEEAFLAEMELEALMGAALSESAKSGE